MIRRYGHLPPDFKLARVPDFISWIASKVAFFDAFDAKLQAMA